MGSGYLERKRSGGIRSGDGETKLHRLKLWEQEGRDWEETSTAGRDTGRFFTVYVTREHRGLPVVPGHDDVALVAEEDIVVTVSRVEGDRRVPTPAPP